MKLGVPFLQLPLQFDAEALAAEVAAIGESAWRPHPAGYPGNDALLLVIPLLWLARTQGSPVVVTLLWCLPLVTIWQSYAPAGPVNLNPLIPIALLALLARNKTSADALPK